MKNLTRHQRNCNGVPPPAVKPTWRKDAIDGRYYCTFEGCNSKKNWTCSSGVWKVINSKIIYVLYFSFWKILPILSILNFILLFYWSTIMQSMQILAMQRMEYTNATCATSDFQRKQCLTSIGMSIKHFIIY